VDKNGEEVLRITDADWEDAATKYSYLQDANTMKNMRNLVDFVVSTQEQFFINDKAYYNKLALANQPATWRWKDGKERMISDLELHLNPKPGKDAKVWAYKKG